MHRPVVVRLSRAGTFHDHKQGCVDMKDPESIFNRQRGYMSPSMGGKPSQVPETPGPRALKFSA